MFESFDGGDVMVLSADVEQTARTLLSAHTQVQSRYLLTRHFVKLREREGQRVNLGRSLKGHLWMVDGGIPFPDALH